MTIGVCIHGWSDYAGRLFHNHALHFFLVADQETTNDEGDRDGICGNFAEASYGFYRGAAPKKNRKTAATEIIFIPNRTQESR
ncbi:MAG: hypothetical protein ABIJ35_06780, partial [Acidobacteriota bacterium]